MTKKTRKGTVMNVEIAQRLAELRRERGFSQEDLANQLGLSRQAVSKWERAESAPDMGNLIALADLYEVTIDELLRVSPEVEEDMRYESQVLAESAEAEAAVAAAAAQEAANRAESAAAEAAARAAKEPADSAKVVVEVSTPQPVPPTRLANAAPWPPAAGAPAYGTPPVGGAPGPMPPFASGVPYGASQPVASVPPAVPVTPAPSAPKDPLRSFPYPLLCAVIFLLVGFSFGWWHPAWVIFLTIPFYYWIVGVLEADPGFQEWRAERAERAAAVAMSSASAANASSSEPAERAVSSSDEGGVQ